MDQSSLRVAVDGPAASGKGTVAYALAQRLDLLYINSGALFRAVALAALENGFNLESISENKLCDLLKEYDFEIIPAATESAKSSLLMNGEDVTKKLYSPEVDEASSKVSRFPEVRRLVENVLRDIARGDGVIMEGRDVGTVFMPDADFKFFLTASLDKRARRRVEDYKRRGVAVSFEKVRDDIAKRDRQDRTRKINPLVKADDAVEIDNTDQTPEETVEEIEQIIRNELRAKGDT